MIALGFCAALTAPAGHAVNEYQFAVDASFSQSRDSGGTEFDSVRIGGEVFLRPVAYGDYPYAEATFFDRQSSLRLTVGRDELEMESVEFNGPAYHAGFTLADSRTPLTFDFDYIDEEVVSSAGVGAEVNACAGRLGYYLAWPALVWVSFEQQSGQFKSPVVNEDLPDYNRWSVGVKSVSVMENATALNLEASLLWEWADPASRDEDRQNEFDVSLDYYINKSASIGAGYRRNWGDDAREEGNAFLGRAEIYISPVAWVSLTLIEFDADLRGYDDSATEILVGLRY